jgi:FtsP/CotA-like multicopper oxidase with cupredoxin domain
MSEKPKRFRLDRRGFLSRLGLAGAAAGTGMALGPSRRAWSEATGLDVPATAWPAKFEPGATAPKYNPRELPKPGAKIREFDIDVTIAKHEILPKVEVHLFTFNGTYPGPEIRVKEGEWVKVNLRNKTPEFHTIHWHGIQLANEMDGVPMGTQWPVGPNQTFQYLWRAQPSGTHFYHCHVMTVLHIQAGLLGTVIIDSDDDIVKQYFPYTRDYTLALSELDTAFVREEMNGMIEMMGKMEAMNASPRMMTEMNGRMMGWFKDKQSFVKAVKDGYIPPYLASRRGKMRQLEFDYFMINGKPYPMTDPVMIKSGENIRVRLVGGGMMPHYFHLHGHDFWHVCQDGSPIAAPIRMNTIPVHPGTTSDIIIQGNNPGNWHFHDHSDLSLRNNGANPGGMMTMLMYEDAEAAGVKFKEVITLDS